MNCFSHKFRHLIITRDGVSDSITIFNPLKKKAVAITYQKYISMSQNKSSADLLKEFEKLINETEFSNKPITFPVDDLAKGEMDGYVNQDPDIPPPVPSERKPKDGDSIELHNGHEIVKAQAGLDSYLYCRDCKVEVVEKKVLKGKDIKLKIDGLELDFGNTWFDDDFMD